MFNFSQFPVLQTTNLILRRIRQADVNDLFAMRSDQRMHQYTDTKPDTTPKETANYIDKMNQGVDSGRWIIWAMEYQPTGRVVGTISIWNFKDDLSSGELGYGIVPDYQGRGLMTEAVEAVVSYGFRVMKLQALEAYTERDNARSHRLLERCNFLQVGELAEPGYVKPGVLQMIIYRTTPSSMMCTTEEDAFRDRG